MLFRQNLPDMQSKIRFLHAVPLAQAVDVYLTGSLLGRNLSFSDISCYENIGAGDYEVQIYPAGIYDKPIFTKNIDILPNTSSTVNIVILGEKIDIFVLNDANVAGNLTNCFLRFIHLSPNSPLLSLLLPNDITLFGNVEYLETTGYYPLSPAIYNFKVNFSAVTVLSKYITDKTLRNGKFYTIYIIGLLNKEPTAGYIMVEDGKDWKSDCILLDTVTF